MKTTPLDEDAFYATVREPVDDITRTPGAALEVDIWPYAEAVFATEYADRNTRRWNVKYVYREAEGRYHHIFINTHRRKRFLVIVLDTERETIVGHRELDLR